MTYSEILKAASIELNSKQLKIDTTFMAVRVSRKVT
jgi:hypothetical protein